MAFFKIPGRDALTNSEVGRRLGVTTPFVKSIRDDLGVKASPASHHGAGSAKQRLNDLPQPVKVPVLEKTKKQPPGKTINVDLSAGDPHRFAVTLFKAFDVGHLKSCVKYLDGLLQDVTNL